MASDEFPYPSDLDSDGGYDSDQYSEYSDNYGDTDYLADNLSNISLSPSSRIPRSPRPRPPSTSSSVTLVPGTPAGVCIVCQSRPRYVNPKTGQSPYPTCGLKCAAVLQQDASALIRSGALGGSRRNSYPSRGIPRNGTLTQAARREAQYTNPRQSRPSAHPIQTKLACVVCKAQPAHRRYVTCGLKCAEKLCKDGGDSNMCDYCHRKPRSTGSTQCGTVCQAKAKVACLLCKCRPKNGVGYHLCGRTCKSIAIKSTPSILEAPKGHKTYEMVEKKFQSAWHNVTVQLPTIKKIFKIIEDEAFLRPYADYKKLKGNECFRYHGTGRQCQLGVSTTQLCSSATCPVCNILKTSFNVSLARPGGAFGAGVYTSSAPNKAYNYTGGNGALLLTKVVLGKVFDVKNFGAVTAPPAGYDSVVYDRYNGHLNETIVYQNEAIRPVIKPVAPDAKQRLVSMADDFPLATCSAAFWSYNTLSQSPCVIGSALAAVCNPAMPQIPALLPDEHYIGPREGYDTPCKDRSDVGCWLRRWNSWSANCTKVFSGVFPEEIPRGVAVPAWAYMDVTVTGFWEPPAAQVYPGAESFAPTPTSTVATPSPTPTVAPPVQPPISTPSQIPNSTVAAPSLGNPNPNKGYRTGGRVNALCALFAAAVFVRMIQ
ncbi:hypothetical protein NMY22_g4206 [Coprinellus aureogranulatus]|nr:hypothetical protein NMY22_g4206 [Coprinellus aureogranulatus]